MLISRSDDERLGPRRASVLEMSSYEMEQLYKDSLRAALVRAEKAEAQLCRAREVIDAAFETITAIEPNHYSTSRERFNAAKTAFDMASAPCTHADEAKRLREVAHDAIQFAVEGWAYAGDYFVKKWNYEGELTELRRRADKG